MSRRDTLIMAGVLVGLPLIAVIMSVLIISLGPPSTDLVFPIKDLEGWEDIDKFTESTSKLEAFQKNTEDSFLEIPDGPLLMDVWLAYETAGVKTGWAHLAAWPAAEGGVRVAEEHYFRRGSEVKDVIHERVLQFKCLMDDDLSVRELDYREREHGRWKTVSAERIRSNAYTFQMELDGRRYQRTFEPSGAVIGSNDLFMKRLFNAGKFQPGVSIRFREFQLWPPKVIEKEMKVLGMDHVQIEGGRMMNLPEISFDTVRVVLSEEGTVLRGRFGGDRVRAVSAEEAPKMGPEVLTFRDELRSDYQIPGLPGAEAVVLKVVVPNDPRGDLFQENEYQKVRFERQEKNGIYHLTLTAFRNKKKAPVQSLSNDPAIKEFLEPDPIRQSDAPQIIEKAKEITEGVSDVREKVRALASWINRNLDKEYTAIGDLTAVDTLERMEGDCSEHAILFDAMARSLGIPVRECKGYVFFGRMGGAHAWSQVLLDGEWVHVDCVANSVGADPMYILMWKHKPGSPRDLTLAERVTVISTRPIQLSVEAIVMNGQKIPISAVRGGTRIRGRDYTNSYLGLSFQAPPAWRIHGSNPTRVRLYGRGMYIEIKAQVLDTDAIIQGWKQSFKESGQTADISETRLVAEKKATVIKATGYPLRVIVLPFSEGTITFRIQGTLDATGEEDLTTLLKSIKFTRD